MKHLFQNEEIKKTDPELFASIDQEFKRQQETIELIASENIVSPSVLTAQGSILTNKYAEGYPAKRYYGGCECVDISEKLAIERAKELFGAEHANVQPHSGSQANMAAYMALLNHGDKILGMDLSCGGHLTHGFNLNFSGTLFEAHSYTIDPKTQLLDYDAVLAKAKEVQPKLIIAGASAYSRHIDFAKFREIADAVGAYLLVDMAHIAGLIAAGLHQNPVPYADVVTSTTHKTLRGPRGGLILCKKEHAKAIDKTIFPGMQGGPLMHVIAGKAVAFKEALQPEFKEYQKQVIKNTLTMANRFKDLGYKIVSDTTDNHLFIVDLREKEINGNELSLLCDECNITLNKNSIPFDTAPPMKPSGVRIGAPAITTRGMKEEESIKIVDLIDSIVKNKNNPTELLKIKAQAIELCSKFPIYNQLI
ncbi:MAG: serine hydroxymethyltransferase [Brevinema sp.]